MRVNREKVINDIIEAVKHFSGVDVEYEFVKERISNIDFNDSNVAHFGINKLAKQIASELVP